VKKAQITRDPQRSADRATPDRGDGPGTERTVVDIAINTSWYREGLRFSCTSCGRCCSGPQSYVWISYDEAVALARHLALDLNDFGRRYLRRVGKDLALLDGAGDDCVFLRDKQCLVYELRPAQCRSFPWWPSLLESEQSWREAALQCEGIRHEAPLVEASVIDAAGAAERAEEAKGHSDIRKDV